jgi:hypothetical protein
MGLGPPVCQHCMVIVHYHSVHRWVCKYCGNINPKLNAWDCGLTEEQLEGNARFLDFVKGTQDASISRGPNPTE